jgi:hypothetical protein
MRFICRNRPHVDLLPKPDVSGFGTRRRRAVQGCSAIIEESWSMGEIDRS